MHNFQAIDMNNVLMFNAYIMVLAPLEIRLTFISSWFAIRKHMRLEMEFFERVDRILFTFIWGTNLKLKT